MSEPTKTLADMVWEVPTEYRIMGMMCPLAFDASGFLLGELAEERPELVAHAAEFPQPLLLRALHSGGVIKAPMDALGGDGKDGATLFGVIANGNHVIESLPGELVHGF